jgi:hypothetical protein
MPVNDACQLNISMLVSLMEQSLDTIHKEISAVYPNDLPGWGNRIPTEALETYIPSLKFDLSNLELVLNECME